MSLKASEIDRAWEKLGFKIRKKADVTADLWVDGVFILRTRRSHGSGKLDGQIPHFIKKQMKLDDKQFQDAVNCPLKREGYIDILKSKGLIVDPKK